MAVLTAAALITKINAWVYQNTTHDITGDHMNEILKDLVDSYSAINAGGAANIAPWSNVTTYTGGETTYVSYANNIYKFIKVTDSLNEIPSSVPSSWELSSAGAAIMYTLLGSAYDDLPDTPATAITSSMSLAMALFMLQGQIGELTSALSFTKLVLVLNQNSTNAPTYTVSGNSTGATVSSFAYISPGHYLMALSQPIVLAGKYSVAIGNPGGTDLVVTVSRFSSTQLYIDVYGAASVTSVDDALVDTVIDLTFYE